MILYPAIDLKDGQCVRLLHGDMEKATVFNTSPADQAQRLTSGEFRGSRWTLEGQTATKTPMVLN